jgi:SepF-like predicted cell division protein (DUF552 family)
VTNTDRQIAIEAYNSGILSQKIVIATDRDLTPKGKRIARIVKLRSAMGTVERIRWYVARRIYNQLTVTPENVTLTREWVG